MTDRRSSAPLRSHRAASPSHGRAAAAAVACLAAVGLASSAWAYSVTSASAGGKTIKRWAENKISYFIHPGGSDDLPFATVDAELKKGFAGWMEPSCSGLDFKPGYHCNTALGSCLYDKGVKCSKETDCPGALNKKVMPLGYNPNGRNELVFAEDGTWKHGTYVLGVTVAMDNNWKGIITEADIAFNGLLQKWTTDPNKAGNGVQHLLSVAIHEQGHFFGVMHVLGNWPPSDPPTMAPNVMPYGISASLSDDDRKAPCFLHPKSGSHACTSDVDCPYIVDKSSQTGKESYTAKLVCSKGTCVWGAAPAQNTVALGGTCDGDTDCQSGLFCQPIGSGKSYCAKTCKVNTSGACPSGFTCYPYQGGSGQGVCLPPLGGGSKAVGASCANANECQTLLCAGGVCAQPCTPGSTGTCPSGQICEAVPGSGGACVAKSGPNLKDLGQQCDAPEECISGVCLKDDINATFGICRQICTVPGSCPDGFRCDNQGDGYTGCVPGKEEVASGDPCTKDSMCKGNICAPAGVDKGGVCSHPCALGDATACPCGMVCADGIKGKACYLSKPLGCLPDESPCDGDAECASGICFGAVCKGACNVGAADACGPGLGCARLSLGSAKGRCVVPGQVADGNFCLGDEVCASLLCLKGSSGTPACADPCLVGDASTCDANEHCVATADGVGACAPGSDPSGAEIEDTGAADAGAADTGGVGDGAVAADAWQPGPYTHAGSSGGGCSVSRRPAPGASERIGLLLWAALAGLGGGALIRARRSGARRRRPS